MTETRFSTTPARTILWSQWAYWSTTGIAIWAGLVMPHGSVRTALVLTPILPGVLIFALTWWLYQACDEYIRLRVLRAAVISALVVSLFALVYFFFELLNFPRLSMMWVNLIGWSVFAAQILKLVWSK